MKQLSLAALVAAPVAAVVAGLVTLGDWPWEDPPKVSITIGLSQVGEACQVLTSPASPEVRRKQDVEWTVAGRCNGIDPANIEVRFGTKSGDSCSGENPLDAGSLQGRKILKKVKNNAARGRYCYGIYNPPSTTPLEDPDLDIRK